METNKTYKREDTPSLSTLRIIDANLNRLREGLRVLEDIFRFVYEDESIASTLKNLRHQVRLENKNLLAARNIQGDILKKTTTSEMKRENFEDIITANIKRAQESSRVLEEIFKSFDAPKSLIFKDIRYNLYDIEKDIFEFLKVNSKLL